MHLVHSRRRLGCPFVFHHDGEPIKKFEKTRKATCKKAGLNGKLFHDFRRTASRNMVWSGISERVVMVITGHKTRSIFNRYNIVSDQDLKEAAIKQQPLSIFKNLPQRLQKRLQSPTSPLQLNKIVRKNGRGEEI